MYLNVSCSSSRSGADSASRVSRLNATIRYAVSYIMVLTIVDLDAQSMIEDPYVRQ